MTGSVITISELILRKLNNISDYKGQIAISELKDISLFKYPCHLQAITVLICMRGTMRGSINLHPYKLQRNTVLINLPGNIIQIDSTNDLDAYAVLISMEFLQSLNLEVFSRAQYLIDIKNNNSFSMPNSERQWFMAYLGLLRHIIGDANTSPDVIKHLAASFATYTMEQHHLHSKSHVSVGGYPSRTNSIIFDRFLELIEQYHTQERTVNFYARMMNISPKYLSKVVKDTSHRRPLDWIRDFVILEAKSMLKFSGLSSQDIARRLNFPTPSAFGKYFREVVGITPKEYAGK